MIDALDFKNTEADIKFLTPQAVTTEPIWTKLDDLKSKSLLIFGNLNTQLATLPVYYASEAMGAAGSWVQLVYTYS